MVICYRQFFFFNMNSVTVFKFDTFLVNYITLSLSTKTPTITSYKPISLLSVIAKTLEKSLLPYITAKIPNTPIQHGYKTQHSTVTALYTLHNTVAKEFNQMAPPTRTINMSKAFDTIHIHTLIRKLHSGHNH